MKLSLSKLTKYVLDFMFFAGFVVILSLHFLLTGYARIEPEILEHVYVLDALLALCGIFVILILHELRKMFTTVLREDCFVRENVISLNRMGIYSFVIAILMLVEIVVYPTMASTAVILVFVIAGLFSRVLAQVFDKAVDYKEQTDLTI